MVILMNHAPPTEGLHHVEQNVSAFIKDKNLGKGTLYITENVITWVSASGEGFSLPYLIIHFHAVCKDLSQFPHECIYMNVDGNFTIGEEEQQSEISGALSNLSVGDDADSEESGSEEDIEPTSEIRFVPDNLEMLDAIFRAISDCQALNPDPEQDEDDREMEGDFNIQYCANGTLEDFEAEECEDENEEEMTEEQFEDADENV